MKKSVLLFTLVLPATVMAQTAHDGAEKHPNVVFIMVDDFGWMDVSYNGSSFYETPNIDRIAAQGMQFTDGYASASISSPTRVSFMTGKYPARNGITDWIPGYQYGRTREQLSHYKMLAPDMPLNMPLEEVTIAEALKENGYATFHVGKWHCAEEEGYYPQDQGFDVNVGGWLKGSPNGVARANGGNGAYNTPYCNPYLEDGPEGEFLTDRLGDSGVELIRTRDKDKPFFLYLSFYAVHTPIDPKPEVVEYFQQKAQKMGVADADPFSEDFEWMRQVDYKAWHWKERTIQNDPEYAALIYTMDQNVGRILDVLAEEGIDENTIVCLMGDNGGLSTAEGSPTTNAPLRAGKGWLYEGGIRVPFLIKYPQVVEAGSVCHTPVVAVDFYPTLLELSGLETKPEQHVDGVSLCPLLEGKMNFNRGPLFFHYPHYGGKGDTPASAIREGDWKLMEFFEDQHIELYNLKEDLSETRDLSAQESARARRLLKKLRNWRKDCDAKLPVANAAYAVPEHRK